MLFVMTNHPGHHEDELISEVLAHARSLRERLRVGESQSNQMAKDCDSFRQEIAQLLRYSKRLCCKNQLRVYFILLYHSAFVLIDHLET